MALPMRITKEDIEKSAKYFASRSVGASVADARQVLGSSGEHRKLISLKALGILVEASDDRLKLSEIGRRLAREPNLLPEVLTRAFAGIPAYTSALEKWSLADNYVITASDLAAYWHDHFSKDVGDGEDYIHEQVIAFFQLSDAIKIGEYLVGRRGQPTRLALKKEQVAKLLVGDAYIGEDSNAEIQQNIPQAISHDSSIQETGQQKADVTQKVTSLLVIAPAEAQLTQQIRDIVKFNPKLDAQFVSSENPDLAWAELLQTHIAVIAVEANDSGIEGNSLVLAGAALGLLEKRAILIVPSGTNLPSLLEPVPHLSRSGDSLDVPGIFALLNALNEVLV